MDSHNNQEDHPAQQSKRYLALYTLAAAGGSAAYVPFLTLLLPTHVNTIWSTNGIEILSYCAFAGAIAASGANIFFGWASDRTAMRRGWIVAGLALSSVMLVAMRFADTVPLLIAMIVLWQIALNMMLNPLLAMAGDSVPDEQKGTLGGLLAFSPACGALVGALITIPGLADADLRLVLVACLSALMVLPVVFFGNPVPMPHLMEQSSKASNQINSNVADATEGLAESLSATATGPVRRMWLARLLVQIGEATLFAFLLLWFLGLDETLNDNFTARLFTLVLFASVPLAFLVGSWSDRTGRPILPLAVSAGGAAIGLTIISFATTPPAGVAGYILFGIMAGIFLALHASQTLRVLPRPETRGRDLGFFNLTNTVPSLVMPWLTLALVPVFGFDALFLFLAALCALACILLATIRSA